ncbi:MAG: zinc-ribbon domain-containing protein [Alphaproteobacteria bacterium]|nr:zinc-ribbon domain-containing protein [Alphaproteobacteria bacterium]
MQIFCPKCKAGYEIDDGLISDKPRRLKCGSCGEVFTVDKNSVLSERDAFAMLADAMGADDNSPKQSSIPETPASIPHEEITAAKTDIADSTTGEPAIAPSVEKNPSAETAEAKADSPAAAIQAAAPAEPEAPTAEPAPTAVNEETSDDEPDVGNDDEEIDIEDIFERLSERTENLINDEKKLPFYRKLWLWIRNLFGLQFRINWKYVTLAVLICGVMWLYNNRYQVVRTFPFANGVYKSLGIAAKISGEGLEFQNINWDLIAEGDKKRLEIRGFIFNKTDYAIKIPTVHVEILDKDAALLQSQNRSFDNEAIESQEKFALSLTVSNAAPTMKYVYLTFIDVD